MSALIIAEAGVNHNGSIELARRLIDIAAEAGADAVKFQTFSAERLVSRGAPKAHYQTRTTPADESQLEMIRKLELGADAHRSLAAHAQQRGVAFLSTPFDRESLVFLIDELALRTIKVSSGDLTDAPFLLEIARRAERVILSTGMSTLAEVEAALGVLAYGFTGAQGAPAEGAFERAYASTDGQRALRERVVLLHCTTEYPAPFAEVNLRAMDTMAAAFGLPVGYSDHTPGVHISVAAAARGAAVIEKHFTLDRTLPGPDHAASVEPDALRLLVASVRDVEQALGDGIKRPTPSEWKNRAIARKSLFTAAAAAPGERLELVSKRPGTGVSPFAYWKLQGQPAARGYAADEPIDG